MKNQAADEVHSAHLRNWVEMLTISIILAGYLIL